MVILVMVTAILSYIHRFYRDNLKNSGISEITVSKICDVLEDDDQLFQFLEYHVAGRSLPSRKMQHGVIDPNIVSVLLNILRDGSVVYNRDNRGIQDCFRSGFVHTEEVKSGQMLCVLPSALHARFVEYFYGRLDPIPFPFQKYPTIRDLCFVLQSFSREMLCNTRDGQRLGPSGQARPPEAVFQDEFYRCYWNEVGPGIGICSEWTGIRQGRIDFQIVDPGWGFELLRDGDRLRDHCSQFSQNGTRIPIRNTLDSRSYGESFLKAIIL
ncbi:hypothetical protein VTN77DRAFT_4868 [Rasamsonia byssochlamydoides]|uniref:uncharacterized protein n=1 Tax=Rasamsonia byssochlamydoides TaxID=89139 RepID=UPI0037430E37